MDRNRCENCAYFEKGKPNLCLRYAPKLAVSTDYNSASTQWGVTDPSVWCSEFKDVKKMHVRGENDSCLTCRHGYISDNGQLTCGKNPPSMEYNRFNKCWFLSVCATRWCGEFEPKDVDHD